MTSRRPRRRAGRKHPAPQPGERVGTRNSPEKRQTEREWAITRSLELRCPASPRHMLGLARQDVVRTSFPRRSVQLETLAADGSSAAATLEPREYPTVQPIQLRWTCSACDRAARDLDLRNSRGGYLRHEGVLDARPVLELFEAMRLAGPQVVRIRLDAPAIASTLERVRSGELLRSAKAHRLAAGGPTGPHKRDQQS